MKVVKNSMIMRLLYIPVVLSGILFFATPAYAQSSNATTQKINPAQAMEAKYQKIFSENKDVIDNLSRQTQPISSSGADNSVASEKALITSSVSQTQNSSSAIVRNNTDTSVSTSHMSNHNNALLDSLKSKLLLLEREKEKLRQELTSLRQQDIQTAKADVNNLQKIQEQARQIKLLQKRLDRCSYVSSSPQSSE